MAELEAVTLVHEGVTLPGFCAAPAGPGPHPGVLVMHNAYGLGDQVKDAAQKLAALGYVAIAGNMYDGFFDRALAGPRMVPLAQAPETLRARVVAWHDLLKSQPQVDAAHTAAIGYCFGGQCVLELARSGADVLAVASYHGLLETKLPAAEGAVSARVAVYTGARDPYAPIEHVRGFEEEMRAAGASWAVTTFGDAYHAFTDPDEATPSIPGLGYDPVAAAVSWAGTLALLDAAFSATGRSE